MTWDEIAMTCDRKFCGNQLVRPGKEQCWCDSLNGPHYESPSSAFHSEIPDQIDWVGFLSFHCDDIKKAVERLAEEFDKEDGDTESVFYDLLAITRRGGGAYDCDHGKKCCKQHAMHVLPHNNDCGYENGC